MRPAVFFYVICVRLFRCNDAPASMRRTQLLSMDVVPASIFEFFYVVCVSRSQIGLDVICVQVETNDVLATSFGAMHTGICTRTAHAPFVQNVNHIRSSDIYIKHAPPSTFELRGLTPAPVTLRRRNLRSECFVNTALAPVSYGGVA